MPRSSDRPRLDAVASSALNGRLPSSAIRGPLTFLVWTMLAGAGAVAAAAEPPVTALAFAPDGNVLLVGSQRGVEQYDWPGLKRQGALATQLEQVHDIEFAPDGNRVAVVGGTPGDEGAVELFSWPPGTLLRRVAPHEDLAYAVAWNADGTRLATAGLDHRAAVVDPDEGKVLRILQGHSRGVTAAAYLPDGEFLVTAGIDQTLRLWDVGQGTPILALDNSERAVTDLAVRPSSEGRATVASVGQDRKVRIWEPNITVPTSDGQRRIGRLVRFARLPATPLSLVWTRDTAAVLVACDDGCLRRVEADTVEVRELGRGVAGWAHSVAVHPHEPAAVIGGERGTLARITW